MNLIKPAPLKKGDTIGLIALSGAVNDCDSVSRAEKYFVSKGFNVKISDGIYKVNRYLAGADSDKLNELHKFFSDDSVKAIIAVRGGYGAIRLVNSIDYDLIKNNPKIFCGFSDVTALSLMMLKKSNLITYSAPMVISDFGKENLCDFTMENFFSVLCDDKEIELKNTGKIYKNGDARGMIWGGNLATIVSLCGLDFIPDDDFILMAEDLNEPVYKIDRMFTQLFNIDKFKKNIKAIVLGDFLDVDNVNWLDEFFVELSEKHNIPIVSGYKITHDSEKLTIPIGAMANLSDGVLNIK